MFNIVFETKIYEIKNGKKNENNQRTEKNVFKPYCYEKNETRLAT